MSYLTSQSRILVCTPAFLFVFAGILQAQSIKAPVREEKLQTLTVTMGMSKVITTAAPAKRVSVTQPNIADVQVLTPTQIMVLGKSVGTTDLIIWGDKEKSTQMRVEVTIDLETLKASMAKLFPNSKLDVTQYRDALMVTGSLNRTEDAPLLQKFLQASGYKNVDMTNVAGVQQVQIRVQVAEVSRTAIRTLGVNFFFTGNDFIGGSTVGPSSGGPIAPINIGAAKGAAAGSGTPFTFLQDAGATSSVTLFGILPNVPLAFFIQALAENQYLRVLAEPDLVALSGQEASFMAGGEYPIPVVQGSATGGATVTIEYRQYGVLLKFRPTVLGDGSIRLYVAPEVSQLTNVGAVVIQGFSIPALIKRKVETTLELKSGQTFGIAGLINRTADGISSRVPWLGDIPVLGALFRSVRYQTGETELVVLVTASLVEPLNKKPAVPGVLDSPPDDWELYALGQVEGKAPPRLSITDAQWLRETGIAKMKGPGAWATYDRAAPCSKANWRPPVATQPADEFLSEEDSGTRTTTQPSEKSRRNP